MVAKAGVELFLNGRVTKVTGFGNLVLSNLPHITMRYFGQLPRRLAGFGVIASLIYFVAKAELVATVLPQIPDWNPAGLPGRSLWVIWLIIVGIRFVSRPSISSSR